MKQEIKTYQALIRTEKEKYVKSAQELQASFEAEMSGFFAKAANGRPAYEIVVEQFRELSYNIPPELIADEEKAALFATVIVCSRMLTYKSGKLFTESIKDKNPDEIAKLIIEKRYQDNKEKDKHKNGEFIGYIRGFAKYLGRTIDENSPEEDVFIDNSMDEELINILSAQNII